MSRLPVVRITLAVVLLVGLLFAVGLRFELLGGFLAAAGETDAVEEARREWEAVYGRLTAEWNGYRRGFRRPPETSCFLFVERCASLASDPAIISRLIGTLGPNIILYAVKFLNSKDPPDVAANMETTAKKCKHAADVIIGKSIEIFQQPGRNLASNLTTISHGPLLKNKLGLIIYGDQPYLLKQAHDQGSVLLRYASTDCSIRMRAEHDQHLPPALRVSGEAAGKSNDVRSGPALASGAPLDFEPTHEPDVHPFVPKFNITAFSWTDVNSSSRSPTFGCLATRILDRIRFDFLADVRGTKESETFRSSLYETALVAINGSFWVQKADPESMAWREALELNEHGFAYVPAGVWHSIGASLEGATAGSLVRIRWRGRKTTKDYFLANGGRMVKLQSGQAFDPSNEGECDVVVVVIQGEGLQVLPFEGMVARGQALVVSAGQPCLFWNSSRWLVKIVAFHVCEKDKDTERLFNGDSALASYFNGGGRLMRR
ncbi:uncharacterized protein LOC116267241 [Nymphaea colorata]|nr:uncharacterized protein LOC116267241 [Nymphaea colorata]